MADGGSGTAGILGVIIGALIVVAVAVVLLNGNPFGGGTKSVDVNITPPAVTAPK